jgi:hypothetical protein
MIATARVRAGDSHARDILLDERLPKDVGEGMLVQISARSGCS